MASTTAVTLRLVAQRQRRDTTRRRQRAADKHMRQPHMQCIIVLPRAGGKVREGKAQREHNEEKATENATRRKERMEKAGRRRPCPALRKLKAGKGKGAGREPKSKRKGRATKNRKTPPRTNANISDHRNNQRRWQRSRTKNQRRM